MYQFMQIYGNCLAVHCLGKNRLRGPVDNVLTKNYKAIELLCNNKYYDYIKNATFIEKPRKASFLGDSTIAYCTDIVRIPHNDPRTKEYLTNLKARCETFNNYLKTLRTNNNNFLIYTINFYDVTASHKLKKNNFINNIKYLKKLNLLNKTIFIATKTKNGTWNNHYATDIAPIISKYNIKYIELTNLKEKAKITLEDYEKQYQYFYKEVKKVIENGTDKKYLKAKANNIKSKSTKSYYLYF